MSAPDNTVVRFPGVQPRAPGIYLDIRVTGKEVAKLNTIAADLGISFDDAAQRAFRLGLKTWKPLDPKGSAA